MSFFKDWLFRPLPAKRKTNKEPNPEASKYNDLDDKDTFSPKVGPHYSRVIYETDGDGIHWMIERGRWAYEDEWREISRHQVASIPTSSMLDTYDRISD